jgi:hypothetical protein
MSGSQVPPPIMREMYADIERLYELHRHKPLVSATWFATEAMKLERFAPNDHRVVYWGCHAQFREIARAYFRGKFDPVERAAAAADGQQELEFAGTLQERYPVRPKPGDTERQYGLLASLSAADRAYNVKRMRATAGSLQKHSDALEAYGVKRDRQPA